MPESQDIADIFRIFFDQFMNIFSCFRAVIIQFFRKFWIPFIIDNSLLSCKRACTISKTHMSKLVRKHAQEQTCFNSARRSTWNEWAQRIKPDCTPIRCSDSVRILWDCPHSNRRDLLTNAPTGDTQKGCQIPSES